MENKFFKGVEVVTGVIIVNSEGKIMLTKSPKWHDKWVIPGGHVEAGETIEQTALREAKEEVGLDLKSLGIISYGEMIDHQDFHRPAHFVYFDVLCSCDDVNAEVRIDENEAKEYKWVLPEDALQMDLGGGTRMAVNSYLKHIHKGS